MKQYASNFHLEFHRAVLLGYVFTVLTVRLEIDSKYRQRKQQFDERAQIEMVCAISTHNEQHGNAWHLILDIPTCSSQPYRRYIGFRPTIAEPLRNCMTKPCTPLGNSVPTLRWISNQGQAIFISTLNHKQTLFRSCANRIMAAEWVALHVVGFRILTDQRGLNDDKLH
jgi:hypothetical protein